VHAAFGDVPPKAVKGGTDNGDQLFIARARHKGYLIPGKFQPSHWVIYVSYGGKEYGKVLYEILCAAEGRWVYVEGGHIPYNAVPAGRIAKGEPLYIGRVCHNRTVTLGKVHPSHGCCYVPYGGEELALKKFEIYVMDAYPYV